jgi:hypothetical protein
MCLCTHSCRHQFARIGAGKRVQDPRLVGCPLTCMTWTFLLTTTLKPTMARCLKVSNGSVRFFTSPASSRYHVPLFRNPWDRATKVESAPFGRLGSTMANDNRIKYNWIKDAEILENYQPGGYHPVMVGDVLHARYHIVDKLGFGGYSTVCIACPRLSSTAICRCQGQHSKFSSTRDRSS